MGRKWPSGGKSRREKPATWKSYECGVHGPLTALVRVVDQQANASQQADDHNSTEVKGGKIVTKWTVKKSSEKGSKRHLEIEKVP
jgi:hypothetical protein